MNRTFAMIIMANNMKYKISTFAKFTLSLPSFMAVNFTFASSPQLQIVVILSMISENFS